MALKLRAAAAAHKPRAANVGQRKAAREESAVPRPWKTSEPEELLRDGAELRSRPSSTAGSDFQLGLEARASQAEDERAEAQAQLKEAEEMLAAAVAAREEATAAAATSATELATVRAVLETEQRLHGELQQRGEAALSEAREAAEQQRTAAEAARSALEERLDGARRHPTLPAAALDP